MKYIKLSRDVDLTNDRLFDEEKFYNHKSKNQIINNNLYISNSLLKDKNINNTSMSMIDKSVFLHDRPVALKQFFQTHCIRCGKVKEIVKNELCLKCDKVVNNNDNQNINL